MVQVYSVIVYQDLPRGVYSLLEVSEVAKNHRTWKVLVVILCINTFLWFFFENCHDVTATAKTLKLPLRRKRSLGAGAHLAELADH